MKKPYIVPDGYRIIGITLAITFLLAYFVTVYIAVFPFLWACYLLYFFRNPSRHIQAAPHELVSPADGTVMAVTEVREDAYFFKKCRKIVIFLSVFNVHVNRAPLAGVIDFQQYTCGRFKPAYETGVGYENERYSIGIKSGNTHILVTLIAGILARRIVSWVALGEKVEHGQLYGMIKLGSCAEIYVDEDVEILVKEGDIVRGGETVIGRIAE
ncbi:phosphatidylserine decarboxylase [uncultured Megasphaera sp.]|uniref:phosphatidylserine decarboxylase n=1 Tax=uncultured Megasphaera sp. TaxID=165188 RepID=UPI0012E220C4|nr:phosphatidylserine decarboxylase [uncultured Megasphaera sp.]MUP50271.1 phosphatidylserine decarboxylase family protein [Veillonellaceae bacterium M1-70]